jgi:zinc transporter, ZIP family
MEPSLPTVAAIAVSAAFASLLGGMVALWRTPTALLMSLSLGFASGVLLATIAFEMLPRAIEWGQLPIACAGFTVGLLAMYGLDLFVHHGQMAGHLSGKAREVQRFYRKRRPRGDDVTVLAGGTTVEELVEGLSIGVGAVIQPGVGFLIALAIAIDNFAEGLSIGELVRSAPHQRRPVARILGWTTAIAVSLSASALLGWIFLRGIPKPAIAFLLASGAGGMFYLTVTKLVPEAEERHYEQSSALAMAGGFLVILALSHWI